MAHAFFSHMIVPFMIFNWKDTANLAFFNLPDFQLNLNSNWAARSFQIQIWTEESVFLVLLELNG